MQVLTKLSLALGLFAVTTKALPVNETEVFKNEPEPSVDVVISDMEFHKHGVLLLGGDGVLRSFSPNLTVLSYAQLSADQIQSALIENGLDGQLGGLYDGVDGRDVDDLDAIIHPAKEYQPVNYPTARDLEFATEQPPTSANPVVFNRGTDKNVSGKDCPKNARCYGPGNCPHYCPKCFVPYPGYAGVCHG